MIRRASYDEGLDYGVRQVASTADAVLSIVDHNPIYMVGTEAGELRMLEDAQRTLGQRIRN